MASPKDYVTVLWLMYIKNLQTSSNSFPQTRSDFHNGISRWFEVDFDESYTDLGLANLEQIGFLKVHDDEFAGDLIVYDSAYIAQEFEVLRNVNLSELYHVARTGGYSWGHRVLNNDNFWSRLADSLNDDGISEEFKSIEEIIPASDRLVTIDHNSRDFENAVSKTEDAAEAIRGSNSLDEDQRTWIRSHIATGIEFIKKNRKVLSAVVVALIIKPLLEAYNQLTEEPAKEAILAAIDAIKAVFGI